MCGRDDPHPLDIESVYSSYCCCGEQDGSITKKTKTRKLTADFLEEFLENRFDVEEVAERGLLSEPLIEEVLCYEMSSPLFVHHCSILNSLCCLLSVICIHDINR